MSELFENENVIHRHSRQQMVDDGLLVVVPTELARQAGFLVPLGVLQEVWESCIAWGEEDSRHQVPQDQVGRLWDLLTVLRYKAKASDGGDTIFFTLVRVPRDGKSKLPKNTDLKAVIGPGDDMKPVITVMFPDMD